MVKYATALRLGTTDTKSIRRRFTRGNLKHPTYQALAELGKARKTVFLCRYLESEALRREVHEALNVIATFAKVLMFVPKAFPGEPRGASDSAGGPVYNAGVALASD